MDNQQKLMDIHEYENETETMNQIQRCNSLARLIFTFIMQEHILIHLKKLIKTAAHSQNRALYNHLNASVILFAFDGRKNTTNCSIYLQASLSYFTFFMNQRN